MYSYTMFRNVNVTCLGSEVETLRLASFPGPLPLCVLGSSKIA